MQKWEYCELRRLSIPDPDHIKPHKVLRHLHFFGLTSPPAKIDPIEVTDETIAKLGLDGWEMISHSVTVHPYKESDIAITTSFYFKRPIR
jgi:hypothetical protein